MRHAPTSDIGISQISRRSLEMVTFPVEHIAGKRRPSNTLDTGFRSGGRGGQHQALDEIFIAVKLGVKCTINDLRRRKAQLPGWAHQHLPGNARNGVAKVIMLARGVVD